MDFGSDWEWLPLQPPPGVSKVIQAEGKADEKKSAWCAAESQPGACVLVCALQLLSFVTKSIETVQLLYFFFKTFLRITFPIWCESGMLKGSQRQRDRIGNHDVITTDGYVRSYQFGAFSGGEANQKLFFGSTAAWLGSEPRSCQRMLRARQRRRARWTR